MKKEILREVVVDGNNIYTKRELQNVLKEKFRFPDYYGCNLDALNDMLSEIDTETILTITNFSKLRERLGHYSDSLLDVLDINAEENELFNYIIIEEELEDNYI